MHHDPRTRPNLFLVGAQKCGTTSMYEYLRCHPQIYFPVAREVTEENGHLYMRTKEPHHFCPDLHYDDRLRIEDRNEYLDLYRDGAGARWCGDATPHYLCSEVAPGMVRQFCPDARILIMLRPPVEMMRSSHNDFLRNRWEDIEDFHAAVDVWEDRREGRRIPPRCGCPELLDYLSLARFAPQVERWIAAFGAHAVKVILLEDMVNAPETTFREILRFLEVNTAFRLDFRIYNEAPSSSRSESLLRSIYQAHWVNRIARAAVPYRIRRAALAAARGRRARRYPAHDPRDEPLRALCRPDVGRLATLIGRDLSHWV
ncbi:MAG: sulfotransferase [Rhodanobacteraceae bacterium]